MDYLALPLLENGDLQDDSYVRKTYSAGDIRLIGRGAYGKVILGEKMDGNEKIKVAVKVIESNDQDTLNESISELMNLSNLKDNQNIISYRNYRINSVLLENKKQIHQLFIEMALATNTLENVLKKNGNLPEDEVKDILFQMAFGLSFAHQKKVAHLDLKPANILLMGDTYAIADWGGSLRLRSSASTNIKSQLAMTHGYNAPELDQENYGKTQKYNYFLCDIYSLGMVTLRLCGIPYNRIKSIPKDLTMRELHDTALKDKICKEIETTYSKELLDLILRMTDYDPNNRISLAELVELIG